jgi:hypothetical protein
LFSGRQLFEKDRRLATSDAAFIEEGVVSVDITQYERTRLEEEDEEENIVRFSDPDSD